MGDVGIYCLNAARYLTGEEPAEVTAVAHQPTDDPRFREVPESGVDGGSGEPDGLGQHADGRFASLSPQRPGVTVQPPQPSTAREIREISRWRRQKRVGAFAGQVMDLVLAVGRDPAQAQPRP